MSTSSAIAGTERTRTTANIVNTINRRDLQLFIFLLSQELPLDAGQYIGNIGPSNVSLSSLTNLAVILRRVSLELYRLSLLSSEKNSSRKPSEQACLRTPRYRRAHRGEGCAQLRYGYRGAGVGMGCSKEGPGSEVYGGCVPSSQPRSTGPSDVEARVSYPLAAFATHKKRGREGKFLGFFEKKSRPLPPSPIENHSLSPAASCRHPQKRDRQMGGCRPLDDSPYRLGISWGWSDCTNRPGNKKDQSFVIGPRHAAYCSKR